MYPLDETDQTPEQRFKLQETAQPMEEQSPSVKELLAKIARIHGGEPLVDESTHATPITPESKIQQYTYEELHSLFLNYSKLVLLCTLVRGRTPEDQNRSDFTLAA